MSEQAVTRAEVVAALRGWRPGAAEVVATLGIDPARGRFPDGAVERAAALWRVLGGDGRDFIGARREGDGVSAGVREGWRHDADADPGVPCSPVSRFGGPDPYRTDP